MNFSNIISLVNCVWGSWSSWSACSVTCGTGTKTRVRDISTHEANGGTACSGDSIETTQLSCGTCPAGTNIILLHFQSNYEINNISNVR